MKETLETLTIEQAIAVLKEILEYTSESNEETDGETPYYKGFAEGVEVAKSEVYDTISIAISNAKSLNQSANN